MKKLILFSILSVLFYSAPGYAGGEEGEDAELETAIALSLKQRHEDAIRGEEAELKYYNELKAAAEKEAAENDERELQSIIATSRAEREEAAKAAEEPAAKAAAIAKIEKELAEMGARRKIILASWVKVAEEEAAARGRGVPARGRGVPAALVPVVAATPLGEKEEARKAEELAARRTSVAEAGERERVECMSMEAATRTLTRSIEELERQKLMRSIEELERKEAPPEEAPAWAKRAAEERAAEERAAWQAAPVTPPLAEEARGRALSAQATGGEAVTEDYDALYLYELAVAGRKAIADEAAARGRGVPGRGRGVPGRGRGVPARGRGVPAALVPVVAATPLGEKEAEAERKRKSKVAIDLAKEEAAKKAKDERESITDAFKASKAAAGKAAAGKPAAGKPAAEARRTAAAKAAEEREAKKMAKDAFWKNAKQGAEADKAEPAEWTGPPVPAAELAAYSAAYPIEARSPLGIVPGRAAALSSEPAIEVEREWERRLAAEAAEKAQDRAE